VLTVRCQHSAAHSRIRPFSRSSPDDSILDNGPSCSLLPSSTMIRSNPDILGDLLPFLHSGGLALSFTSRLVLLVEDNSNDRTVLGEQQSQLTSYQRPKISQSEKMREWCMRSRSSYNGYLSVQRNVTGSPATITVTALPSHTSARCFRNGYLVRFYRASSLLTILSMCSSATHLAGTRPHSRTTLAYESIAHTSTTNSIHGVYGWRS